MTEFNKQEYCTALYWEIFWMHRKINAGDHPRLHNLFHQLAIKLQYYGRDQDPRQLG